MVSATDVTQFKSISVRCDADMIDELRAKYPALKKHVYFSERLWTLIVMDNTIADTLVMQWIDESYELAVKNLQRSRGQAWVSKKSYPLNRFATLA